ncbi:MAG TPA: phosphate acyltransferase PlsX [Candidatus Limnocylindria bacterium]|nr:phosphate acyltransferase PlsX [Candidatus Limnocylindria bacterium]
MIALDAMGGDFAPAVTVQGAVNAAKRGIHVGLFGDEATLEVLLNRIDTQWSKLPLTIVNCTQIIGMGDEPGRSVLAKKDSSLVRAVQATADGTASAVVSAGNSGAALIAGTLIIGRIEGIMRPALGNFLPTLHGSVFCLDLGANTECRPEYLDQFALMGVLYVRAKSGIKEPRVALLSNGSEPYKGSMVVKQAYTMLDRGPLQFVGNVEARDIFDDRTDVLVCDGFTGNIMLKAIQGTVHAATGWIRQEGERNWLRRLALLASSPLLKSLKRQVDYAQRGGAIFLGLKKPFIVAHGCSTAVAIERAIMFAHELVDKNVMTEFNKSLHHSMQYAMARVSPNPQQTPRLYF